MKGLWRDRVDPFAGVALRHQVWLAGGLMILVQAAFRAWAVYPGFFYGDDYRLVREAGLDKFGISYLTQPYDAQFMPYGRMVAWIAARPELMEWSLLATSSLIAQVVAGVACFWMLGTVFGWRWGILGPLALYLSCAMTMPVLMWWAAGLNQIPLQAVFFATIAAWVHYLRNRSWWWLLATFLIIAFGLLCYVKTLLLFPILAFIALAYFSEGRPIRRVRIAVRAYWPAVLAGLAGAATFTAYYVTQVPQLATTGGSSQFGGLLNGMLGTSFAVGAFGGPWRWDDKIAPAGLADPPAWAVHLSWVLAALIIAYLALRRERTLRAWLMLAAYLAADFTLLLTTRAPVVGAVTGSEYRYLTDSTCALTLAVSLASMQILGAVQSSVPRSTPLLIRGLSNRVVAVGVTLVVVSGAFSAWGYARMWHTENVGDHYLHTAIATMQGSDEVDLADQDVPATIIAPFGFPYNRTRILLPLVSKTARFPEATDSLHILDENGAVHSADLDVAASSLPAPANGCGWKVTATNGASIPLERETNGFSWWLKIEYLASGDSGVRVVAGDGDVTTEVFRGLGDLYVYITGGVFDEVRFEDLDPGVTLCVDTIDVGTPVPEGEGS
jgi:hypothetical protein